MAAGLIAFNKYLMNAELFPYAKAMTATWMCYFRLSQGEIHNMGNLLGLCLLLPFGGLLSKKKPGDAHAHDHSSVTLALHCRTFAVPKHG